MKKHINLKYNQLDVSLYYGKKLGQYAIIIEFNERYQLCLTESAKLLNQDQNIVRETLKFLFEDNCNCNNEDLPCIHEIYERLKNQKKGDTISKEEDIPAKYFYHDLKIENPNEIEIVIVETDEKEDWGYNSTMDKLQPYVDLAQRNEPVCELSRNFFHEAENLKKTIDPNANGIIVTAGAQPTVPSATVDKYLPKKKRSAHCSFCHRLGHYASTCPSKKKKDN